jgi:hypothetical protein
MILCNGTPKAGTHLLKRAVLRFDRYFEKAQHAHVSYSQAALIGKDRKHIHIVRNPRNVLISWLRFNGIPLTRENIIEEMPKTIKRVRAFLPWLEDPNTLTVKFELLLADPAELQKIADYLGEPLSKDHFKKLWGRTQTFTEDLSNWRDHWRPSHAKKWEEAGGLALEKKLGYNMDDVFIRRCDG